MACDLPICDLNNVTVVWDKSDTCPVCTTQIQKDDRIRRYGTMAVHEYCAWCIVCGSRDCSQPTDNGNSHRILTGKGIMHEECTRCGICDQKTGEGIMERFPLLFTVTKTHGCTRLVHASCIGCQCILCEMKQEREDYRPSGDWAKWGKLPVDEFAEVEYKFERRYDKVILDPACRTCTRCCMPVVCMPAPRYTADDYPVAHEVCKRCDKCMCKYRDNRDHIKCLPKLKMKSLSTSTKRPRRVSRHSLQ